MPSSIDILWFIPALPLLAAFIGAISTQRMRSVASGSALSAMAVSFGLSCIALKDALAAPGVHQVNNFSWVSVGTFNLQLGFLLDPLTAFMLVMVTFVGFLIFLFSTGYMKGDENYAKFFCYLSLFAAAMLGILVSNSLLLTFICWEVVGLASYLLIGFWFFKPEAAAAAKKAFITTRIGDLGFLIGLIWLHSISGTQLFYNNGEGFLETINLVEATAPALFAISAIGILLFCGAIGKSGQFPLHVWLPDAMEGPTPVSALIHAATMVAAGVFLMARVFPLLEFGSALTVVAYIGAITALLGAVIAVAQNDIKRILAFSTVSQLGYMMLAIGVGVWEAAIFHLLTHAFFKALLFLGAGSVIHAAHHEQDIRALGGLAPRMKITFATFSIGMMALAGVPFLFSGFWSKEAILHGAHTWSVSHIPFYIGLVAVVLTAFYMTRLMANVFFGKPRSHAVEHAHENNWVMTLPLTLLAICAILLGFLGTPAFPWLQAKLLGKDLSGALEFGKIFEGPGLMITSIVLVALGLGIGWAIYGFRKRERFGDADPLEKRFPGLWSALEHRLYFDELYAATILKTNSLLASFSDWLDRWIVDGAVQLVSKLGTLLGFINRDIDEQCLNAGFNETAEEIRGIGNTYSKAQSGDVHGYLRVMAWGFVAIVILVSIALNI
ncbi:MAG: NADH-quinone oxidoreductase subunit L [Puniceicoccales bacterium]|jgi:NADH-quinone oxidoreductase subunit L|nr:NADH-quinone oxidoreductase subunit L [Puniceicoccales bacterium]